MAFSNLAEMPLKRTTVTWSLRPGIRSAIDAEAARRSLPPSKVAEALLARYLPDFVAQAIRESLQGEPVSDESLRQTRGSLS